MCAGNELWFSMVYMLHFSEGPSGSYQRIFLEKNISFKILVITFAGYAMGLWRFILYAVTPIMILKQIISLVHLYTAALDMAAIDEAERANKAKTN
jgi:CDP-diacylglycerol--inositol 3-phosphatidyltransferase